MSEFRSRPRASFTFVFICLSLLIVGVLLGAGSLAHSAIPKISSRPAAGDASQLSAEAARVIGKIAFGSDRDGNFEIYTMETDGGAQFRLTEDPGEDYSPAWSPDGTRIAFVTTRDGNPEIYVMNMDGTGQTRLTNNSADDIGPKWAPDGSRIAFFTNRDGNDEIYSMNPDGSNQLNLTNNPADDASFAYSPNGLMIAFTSSREESQFDIYTMSSSGGGAIRLTTAVGDDVNPSWSNQQIAFQSNRDDTEELYSMGSSGQNQTRLTNNADLDVDSSQPTDGSKIAFASGRDGNLEIYLMNPNGSGLTRLSNNNAADIQPALQPLGVIPAPPAAGTAIVQFTGAVFSGAEGTQEVTLTVARTGDTTGTTTVDFGTVNGTATNRIDYAYRFGRLKFNPGETSKSFTVLITDDVFIENDETLTATLSNPTGGSLGSLNTATVTVADNDTSQPNVNPIDNARFFVTQQYADFLNRAPDQAGSDYWTNEITRCGSNPSCLIARRNGVSAAFFIENEFQITGFYVYRLYKASFGVVPTRQQFIMDRSRLKPGPTFETDKADLTNDFVMRGAFLARYPETLTPEEFVNRLFDTAGLVPFTAERQKFAQDMRNGKTRAQVLAEVVEISAFRSREFNPAFVLMEYFGYLGRDPDPAGFAFWLNVINNVQPNNYTSMVCAFITSAEYQMRFSTLVTQSDASCSSLR